MKTLLTELRTSLFLTAVFAILLCGIYPLTVWAGGKLLFPTKAQGSLILDKQGAVIGSELIGQAFASPKYFYSRPSAAGTGYDAANSSGTNLGSTSKKLKESIQASVDAYRSQNGLPLDIPVPADAVTCSASGLDPHISIENARLQAGRVARERGLEISQVVMLIEEYTLNRDLRVFGDPCVRVLALNHALDELSNRK